MRVVEIAELLGVSKQRAHQLAGEAGFPARSPRTVAVVCGIGARSQHGRSVGGGEALALGVGGLGHRSPCPSAAERGGSHLPEPSAPWRTVVIPCSVTRGRARPTSRRDPLAASSRCPRSHRDGMQRFWRMNRPARVAQIPHLAGRADRPTGRPSFWPRPAGWPSRPLDGRALGVGRWGDRAARSRALPDTLLVNSPGTRTDHRVRTVVSVLLVSMTSLVAIASPAHATNPEVILARPRAGEYQPVRGEGWLAWQQNSMRRPRHYDVLVRDVDGGPTTRVNPAGTNGANGDIAGNILVYQQFEERRSGVRFFDLTTGERSHSPNGVNNDAGSTGRACPVNGCSSAASRAGAVRDASSCSISRPARARRSPRSGAGTRSAPGQVTGDWAVWSRCAARSPCTAARYTISTQHRPRHRRSERPGPSLPIGGCPGDGVLRTRR